MDPGRWRRVEDLFHRALECDEVERARFLDDECGGDPDLRQEVQRWLAADADAPARLAGAVGGAVRSLHADVSSLQPLDEDTTPPARIGPYRIVGEIGHGGMGTVYLAERADDQFRQQVAIKLVRHTLDSPAARGRFLQERQVLAQLNHPGIARLLDGGASDEGQPVLRDAVRGGPPPARVLRRAGPRRAREAPAVPPRVRGRPVRASEPGRASRHQAGQHPRHRRRTAEAAGFRHREAD